MLEQTTSLIEKLSRSQTKEYEEAKIYQKLIYNSYLSLLQASLDHKILDTIF